MVAYTVCLLDYHKVERVEVIMMWQWVARVTSNKKVNSPYTEQLVVLPHADPFGECNSFKSHVTCILYTIMYIYNCLPVVNVPCSTTVTSPLTADTV